MDSAAPGGHGFASQPNRQMFHVKRLRPLPILRPGNPWLPLPAGTKMDRHPDTEVGAPPRHEQPGGGLQDEANVVWLSAEKCFRPWPSPATRYMPRTVHQGKREQPTRRGRGPCPAPEQTLVSCLWTTWGRGGDKRAQHSGSHAIGPAVSADVDAHWSAVQHSLRPLAHP